MTSSLHYIWACLLGSLFVFSFLPFDLFFLPYLIFPTFFFILDQSDKKLATSLLFGFFFFSTGLYWLILCINNYGGASLTNAIIICSIFYVFLSLFFLPFVFFKKLSLLSAIALFIVLEIVREYIFTGFPWLSIGFSQTNNPLVNNYYQMIGSHGVSLLVLLISALLYISFRDKNKRKLSLFIIALIISTNFLIDLYKQESTIDDNDLNISLLQGNVNQAIKWDTNTLEEQINVYIELLNQAQGEIIIFPETAIPLIYKSYPNNFNEAVENKINENKSVIIGSIFEDNGHYLNGAIIKEKNKDQFYFKEHLVPFGEYFPLVEYFGFFYEKILDIPFSNLIPPKIKNNTIHIKDHNIGLNICYEDIFKTSYDKFNEADLFINLTNDAWYDRSPAAHQHLQIAQARAMEYQKPIVRATNTGVTAYIDAQGKVQNQLPIFTTDILELSAQTNKSKTIFAKYGYIPLYIILFFILFADKVPLSALLKVKKKVKSLSNF